MQTSRTKICRNFSEYINPESQTFDCDCDTFGNHKNLVTFCEQCVVFDFQAAQIHSCSSGNLAANDVWNFCQMVQFHFNNIINCLNREIFLHLIDLDLLPLDIFLKSLDGPFFNFSNVYNEILVSLDNPYLCDFVMPNEVGEINLMEEVE